MASFLANFGWGLFITVLIILIVVIVHFTSKKHGTKHKLKWNHPVVENETNLPPSARGIRHWFEVAHFPHPTMQDKIITFCYIANPKSKIVLDTPTKPIEATHCHMFILERDQRIVIPAKSSIDRDTIKYKDLTLTNLDELTKENYLKKEQESNRYKAIADAQTKTIEHLRMHMADNQEDVQKRTMESLKEIKEIFERNPNDQFGRTGKPITKESVDIGN